MAITFSIFKKHYADNLTNAVFQTTLKTDLDALSITTVYEISIEHLQGFWVVVCIYA